MSDASASPFFQLDPDQRPRREDLVDQGRGGLQLQRKPEGWRKLTRAELAASIAMPATILLGIALGESGAPLPVTVTCFAVLILSLVAFGLSGRRQSRR